MSTDVHFHWKEELIKIILLEFHWPPWPLSVYYSLLPFSVSNAQQESILWEGLRGSPPWLHTDITWGTLKTTNAWILPLEILFNWYGVPRRHLNFFKAPQGSNSRHSDILPKHTDTHTHTHTHNSPGDSNIQPKLRATGIMVSTKNWKSKFSAVF